MSISLKTYLSILLLPLLANATDRASASTQGGSGNTMWINYLPGDIADNRELHSNFGGFPSNHDGSIWTNSWNVTAEMNHNPSFPLGTQPGFMMYGPYIDLDGPGDITADIELWVLADKKGIPHNTSLAKIELTASYGREFLDVVRLQGDGSRGNDKDVGYDRENHRFSIHLESRNVRDVRGIEMRIAEVNNFTTVEFYSARLTLIRYGTYPQ